jgi:hypothetical protein
MKLYRLCIALGAFILPASAIQAQPGITGGFNTSTYKYTVNDNISGRSAYPAFNAGLFYRGSIARHAIIEPSLLFTRKGARNNNTPFPADYTKNRLDYIQLNVPLMYRGWISRHSDFTVGGGPYAALLANASVRTQYRNGDQDLYDYSVGTDNRDDFKPLDAGLRFGAGFRYDQVNVSIAYDLGLADIAPQNNISIRNRSFSVNLGFMFW